MENVECSHIRIDILNSLNETKKQLLINEKIRKKFLEEENHYEFVWLVQSLKDEELKYFIDDSLIDNLLLSSRVIDKINALMNLDNNYKNIVLNNNKIIEFIFNNNSLTSWLSNMSFPFTETVFEFIIENGLYDYLKYLDDKQLYQILKKNDNLSKLKFNCKNYINYLPIETINENYDNNVLLEQNIYTINELVKKGLILKPITYMNKTFLDKYLEIDNVERLRSFLENLSINNIYTYQILDRLVSNKYDLEVSKMNDDGILEHYSNINMNKSYAREKSLKTFLDMLIDKNFLDLTDNVLINLETIIKFNEENKVIPDERIEIYKSILNFSNLSIQEQKNLYYKLNKKYREYLYEDFRNCQDNAYTMLNDSLLDLSKLNKTNLNGIDVYELKGEPFYIPIHLTSVNRIRIVDDTLLWREKLIDDTLSISIISDSLLNTYQDPTEHLAFGFNKLNINNIMHMYHSDSYTMHSYGTSRVNEIMTPQQLIDSTKDYNEILLKEVETIKPDYIICYDRVLEQDYMAARKMNIPIVLIHTRFYKKNNTLIEYRFDNVPKYKKL